MKAYIAACFQQQEEVKQKAKELQMLGVVVTSRWRYEQGSGDGSEPSMAAKYAACADFDLHDIEAADTFILLAGQVSRTGGKHVETGYALAKGKRVIVVGPAENVFHWHDDIILIPTWQELLRYICHSCGEFSVAACGNIYCPTRTNHPL